MAHSTASESESQEPWTHRLGVLAWAPPSPYNQAHPTTTGSEGHTDPSSSTLWPCILYPSWSKAVLQSGIITADEKEVKLIGCKRAVATQDLSRNRVPKSLALGSGVNGSKYRPRVVVHFFGLGEEEPSWGAVKVEHVKQYTLESCQERLLEMMNSWDSENWLGTDQGPLYLAMQEASIVMDRPAYDPSNICRDIGIDNYANAKDPSSTSTSRDDADATVATTTDTTTDEGGDGDGEEEMTPECFDDWRTGGNTQKNMESQSQNFSQVQSLSNR